MNEIALIGVEAAQQIISAFAVSSLSETVLLPAARKPHPG